MAQRIYLAVAGVLFAASGLFALIDPAGLGEWLGIGPVNPSGETEIRATYGGLVFGIGVLLLCGLRSARLAFSGLAVMVFGVGGLVLIRFLGEAFSGDPGIAANQGIVIIFESIAVAGAILFLRRELRER